MALIEYKNANIYHSDGETVLEGINFTADSNEFIYIIGKVGTGKSSLLRSFYADCEIDEAEKAMVLDNDMLTIRQKEIPALRRKLGIIFQNFQLLQDRTVYQNLRFVLLATGWNKDIIDQRIDEVLKAVEMKEAKDKLPHQLSGGEQQRIAIARALLNTPKVILADEPTGNLDPETADNILHLLREIASSGTAVIMTTHNLQMLHKFPGIVYLTADKQLKNITDSYRTLTEEEI